MVILHLHKLDYDLHFCSLWGGSMQCKYIILTQKDQKCKQFSLYMFKIVMAALFLLNVSSQDGDTFWY